MLLKLDYPLNSADGLKAFHFFSYISEFLKIKKPQIKAKKRKEKILAHKKELERPKYSMKTHLANALRIKLVNLVQIFMFMNT